MAMTKNQLNAARREARQPKPTQLTAARREAQQMTGGSTMPVLTAGAALKRIQAQAHLAKALEEVADAEATAGELAADQQYTMNVIRLLHAATMLSMAQANIKQAMRQLQEVLP